MKETPIAGDDIRTFAKICIDIMDGASDDIVKAIYLRRHYEIIDEVGHAYNLLASLFKGRLVPTIATALENRDMGEDEKTAAEAEVQKMLPAFNYDALVAQVTDATLMKQKFAETDVGYEKIQLFRVIKGKHQDDVISKFINESYHIENEYVMQLNPHKFESVPEYVVDECEKALQDQ